MKDKVVIVTGGSRGIGATIAKELGKQGAKVVINYNMSAGSAESLLREIKLTGGTAIACKADVANLEDAQYLIETTKSQFGRIDILVNNAGITRDVATSAN